MMYFVTYNDDLVVALTMSNGGIVHRADLRAAGISRHVQGRMVRDQTLRRVTASVFALGPQPLDWHQQLRVALAHAGPLSVVSHSAACVLWAFPRVGGGRVELAVPRGTRFPAKPFGRLHRSRDLSDDQLGEIAGFRVTSPGRTLFDMAARLGPVVLDECVQDLARRDLVTLDGLAADLAVRRRSGLTGVVRMAELLESLTLLPMADSWLEARFLRLMADHGIPPPETQVWFGVDGQRYRVDALWRDARLIVELKGYGTHATRKEMSADAEREARLGSLGYEIVSFTHDQVVGNPRFVVAQVGRRVLVRRAG